MRFIEKLELGWKQSKFVCVGLDPRLGRIPAHIKGLPYERVETFCKSILRACGQGALAFKPNLAFYEALDGEGLQTLHTICSLIKAYFPEVVIIADAKRGDIGSTNEGYVAMLKWLGVDAVTLNPYLGEEANRPFLDSGLGCIFLCKTSNAGSGEFQNIAVHPVGTEVAYMMELGLPMSFQPEDSIEPKVPLYEYIAYSIATRWNQHGNCALVVGATYPAELETVRGIVGRMPILVPGIGAQGGNLEATVRAGLDDRCAGIIVNSSRGIIHASEGQDFDRVALRETVTLNEAINEVRDAVMSERSE